jgi:hypothetical protein
MVAARKFKTEAWWNADKGKVNREILSYVRTVENFQILQFEKMLREEALYDQNPRTNRRSIGGVMRSTGGHRESGNRPRSVMVENLVAQGVDTIAANVSDSDISIRIQTDDADWSHQQNAKRLERYSNALMAVLGVVPKCQYGFKLGAALKGTGVNKVWIDQFDQVQVRPIPIENVIVDELECRDGKPQQIHYREFYDRELLIAQFPEFAEQIYRAQTIGDWRRWAGYRPIARNEIVVIESWRLPIGPKDHPNHVAGRHTICIHGVDLLDEEYEDDFFPFSIMRWNDPVWGFYGHSLAERILPHQALLNRRQGQITASLDRKASPMVWVHKADKNLAFKTFAQVGITAGSYSVNKPEGVDYQAVGQETYQDLDRIRGQAERETGINQMMVSGGVPAGIESGVGVREARQTHSQRFSIQERAYEQFIADTMWLVIAMCKKLGAGKVPDVLHVAKYGGARPRLLKWKDVDLNDLKYELVVSSAVSNTPAGRQQRVTELAQAGIVTLDEARQLIEHPDIDRIISLYNAAIESVQWVIERIENGEANIAPEPFMNLKMCVVMMQREYLLIQTQAAPETILEALSDFISTAASILNPPAPPANQNVPMAPGVPGMPAPGGPPGMPPPGVVPGAGPGAMPSSGPTQTFNQGAFGPMSA